ncbi:PIN domain-containing protein, partial [Roseateles sp.]|uniref:PIN domain-containing protein n=1 Tax=Roseateles sp. TaxID=1971397 RepID=UPI003918C7AC
MASPAQPSAPTTPQAKPAPKSKPAPKARSAGKPKSLEAPKLFVLDTNVLMHDPMCLFRFEEHDIYLPMITLEELDGHKKGMSEV